MRFNDISQGDATVMQNLTQFLCVRPYKEVTLKKYEDKASNISYGVQAAKMKVEKWHGFDSYEGNNKYLSDMLPSTRRALEEFYEPANRRLEQMMGTKLF